MTASNYMSVDDEKRQKLIPISKVRSLEVKLASEKLSSLLKVNKVKSIALALKKIEKAKNFPTKPQMSY